MTKDIKTLKGGRKSYRSKEKKMEDKITRRKAKLNKPNKYAEQEENMAKQQAKRKEKEERELIINKKTGKAKKVTLWQKITSPLKTLKSMLRTSSTTMGIKQEQYEEKKTKALRDHTRLKAKQTLREEEFSRIGPNQARYKTSRNNTVKKFLARIVRTKEDTAMGAKIKKEIEKIQAEFKHTNDKHGREKAYKKSNVKKNQTLRRLMKNYSKLLNKANANGAKTANGIETRKNVDELKLLRKTLRPGQEKSNYTENGLQERKDTKSMTKIKERISSVRNPALAFYSSKEAVETQIKKAQKERDTTRQGYRNVDDNNNNNPITGLASPNIQIGDVKIEILS